MVSQVEDESINIARNSVFFYVQDQHLNIQIIFFSKWYNGSLLLPLLSEMDLDTKA